MKRSIILAGILLLTMMLAGCKPQRELPPTPGPTAPVTPVARTVSLGEPVQLQRGGEVSVTGSGLKIVFRDVVEDSRCPKNVECVWAGQVIVALKIIAGEGPDGSDALLGLNGPPDTPPQVQVGDYTIELLAVDPYPAANSTPIPPVITLVVTETRPSTDQGSGPAGMPTKQPEPPVFTLVLENEQIAGTRGTFCWAEASGMMCVDMLTPPTIETSVTVAAGDTLLILFEDPPPDLVTFNLYEASAYTGDPTVPPLATSKELRVTGDSAEWTLEDLPPGEYILAVAGRWPDRTSDAVYFFALVIE